MAERQKVSQRRTHVTKAALTELVAQLRRATVGGVVPEAAFLECVRDLGLGQDERERVRDELLRLRVPVRKTVVHADVDTPDVQKVARKRGETVFPRIDRVQALLERYADDEGYVTSRALDGVVRLAGLNSREAAALRGAARVRPGRRPESTAGATPDDAGEEPPTAGDARLGDGGVAPGEPPVADDHDAEEVAGGPAGEFPAGPSETAVPTNAGLTTAVAAARAVIGEERYRRRPEKHLLTAQEEVGLAVLVRGGTGEEPDQAALSALPPDDIRIRARDCLIVHNQGLVHSLVRRHLDQGLDYDDLFQHGVLGLMWAARKFDPTKGFKFSTYATWWIRQSITRAVADEGSVIRIPVHMHERIRRVANAERSVAAQGRSATAADVAVLCDLSLSKVEEARRLSQRTDSLDRVLGDGATLGDFIARTRAVPSVEEGVLKALLREQVMAVVDTFSGRDHRILVRRLGLDDDEPSTLEQLGSEFGVSRERIRQLESKLVLELRSRLRRALLDGVGAVVAREASENARRAARTVVPGRPGSRTAPAVRRVRAGTPAAPVVPAPPGDRAAAAPVIPEDSAPAEVAVPAVAADRDSVPTGVGPAEVVPAEVAVPAVAADRDRVPTRVGPAAVVPAEVTAPAVAAEARVVQGQQIAAGRLAQAEHDAWVRINELQTQLAALQAPAAGRAALRDRWRRS